MITRGTAAGETTFASAEGCWGLASAAKVNPAMVTTGGSSLLAATDANEGLEMVADGAASTPTPRVGDPIPVAVASRAAVSSGKRPCKGPNGLETAADGDAATPPLGVADPSPAVSASVSSGFKGPLAGVKIAEKMLATDASGELAPAADGDAAAPTLRVWDPSPAAVAS